MRESRRRPGEKDDKSQRDFANFVPAARIRATVVYLFSFVRKKLSIYIRGHF